MTRRRRGGATQLRRIKAKEGRRRQRRRKQRQLASVPIVPVVGTTMPILETLGGVLDIPESVTRFIQEFGMLGGDPAAGEVEPWQPWGGRRGVPKGYKEYDNVYIQDGRVWAPMADGSRRSLGYTPAYAKKKYKTKRRRKRLTKRDMFIITAMQQNPQSSAALAMML